MHRVDDNPPVNMCMWSYMVISCVPFLPQGPGLYHYRATIVDRVSFCNLQTQFTVSVIVHDIVYMYVCPYMYTYIICVHARVPVCALYMSVCVHACTCPSMCTSVHLDCMMCAHFMQTFLCVALQQSSPWSSLMNYPTVISHAMSTITCIYIVAGIKVGNYKKCSTDPCNHLVNPVIEKEN